MYVRVSVKYFGKIFIQSLMFVVLVYEALVGKKTSSKNKQVLRRAQGDYDSGTYISRRECFQAGKS